MWKFFFLFLFAYGVALLRQYSRKRKQITDQHGINNSTRFPPSFLLRLPLYFFLFIPSISHHSTHAPSFSLFPAIFLALFPLLSPTILRILLATYFPLYFLFFPFYLLQFYACSFLPLYFLSYFLLFFFTLYLLQLYTFSFLPMYSPLYFSISLSSF